MPRYARLFRRDRGRVARPVRATASAQPEARAQRDLHHHRRAAGRCEGDRSRAGARARASREARLRLFGEDVALWAPADDRGRLGPAASRAFEGRGADHRHLEVEGIPPAALNLAACCPF